MEIGGLECAVYCSLMLFAAQLWAVKMADVGWQKAVSGGLTVSSNGGIFKESPCK